MRPRSRHWTPLTTLVAAGCLAFFSGCATPSKANIQLRKQNQQLQAQITNLNRQRDMDLATIRGLQAQATTEPILPQWRLDQLFTTAGIEFGSLTGGYHADTNSYGDTELRVFVVPYCQQGQKLKAAGAFHVDLFDLALGNRSHIGSWDFPLSEAPALWYGSGFLYTYVLECPWQTPPTHPKLTMHVVFTDGLTHRVFAVDKDVTVQPPK